MTIILLVARSYLMSVMPDLVQVALLLLAAILGRLSHSGSLKWPRDLTVTPFSLCRSSRVQSE